MIKNEIKDSLEYFVSSEIKRCEDDVKKIITNKTFSSSMNAVVNRLRWINSFINGFDKFGDGWNFTIPTTEILSRIDNLVYQVNEFQSNANKVYEIVVHYKKDKNNNDKVMTYEFANPGAASTAFDLAIDTSPAGTLVIFRLVCNTFPDKTYTILNKAIVHTKK